MSFIRFRPSGATMGKILHGLGPAMFAFSLCAYGMYKYHVHLMKAKRQETMVRELSDRNTELMREISVLKADNAHNKTVLIKQRWLAALAYAKVEAQRRRLRIKIKNIVRAAKAEMRADFDLMLEMDQYNAEMASRNAALRAATSRFVVDSEKASAATGMVVESSKSAEKRTLGSLESPFLKWQFSPPNDWRNIGTAKVNANVHTLCEVYKRYIRWKNKSLPENQRVPEHYLIAETKFWNSKGMVPKHWLDLELPSELADWADSAMAPKPKTRIQTQNQTGKGIKREPPPNHVNGETDHRHDQCPYPTLATLITVDDSGNVVTAKKLPGKGKGTDTKLEYAKPFIVKPAPPVMADSVPVVSLTEIQNEQLVEQAEQRKRELANVTVETVADKAAKSKADKQSFRERASQREAAEFTSGPASHL